MKKRSLLLTSSILIACMFTAYRAMTAVRAVNENVVVSVSPSSQNIPAPGTTFQLNITISNVTNLWAWSVQITWNPAVLNCTNVAEGSFLSSQASPTFFLAAPPDNEAGLVDQINDVSMKVPPTGASGSGVLTTLTFLSTALGNSNITILNTAFKDVPKNTINVTVENGEIIVIPEFPASAMIPAVIIITTAVAIIITKISKPRRRLDYIKTP